MEFFRNAQTVRLRSPHGYLVAKHDEETVALEHDEKTAALERDEETAALQSDEETAALERDEETAALERDEETAALQSDEETSDEETDALQSDEETVALERDEETAALQSDEETDALQSDEETSDEETVALERDEETDALQSDEETAALQSDEETDALQSDEETSDEETVALERDEETDALQSDEETAALQSDEESAARGDNDFSDRARWRDEETAARGDNDFSDRARWSVEFVLNSDSVLRLKSCYGKYLAASDEPSPLGMTGCLVLQSPPPLLDSEWVPTEWEPMMEGTHVKLRTHYGSFLCTGRHYAVIHDLPHHTTFLWDVEVVMRKEGSATNIDNKASEEGSASNIDDKASASNIEDKASEKGSASKRRHETGEGSSVTKSPPGVSAPIREGAGVTYRSHFWELKNLLWDDSGRKDVLVEGGSGTTALVREVCADVREHFSTIAYISIPQKNDSESIREEILLQLIFERAAFPKNFDSSFWATDDEFSLQQKARCLIVVDNLDDGRTWKKFEEVLRIVETCRVIFIARPKMGSPDSQVYQYGQINQCGREFVTYQLGDLSFVPRAHHMKDFLKDGFHSPSKRLCELIVSKCKRLPTAITFVLHEKEDLWRSNSSEIKDEWKARIPSVDLRLELHVIQQVLGVILDKPSPGEADGPELYPIQQVLEILRNDDRLFCLLYLSIFPENSRISCKRVSRLWAAERMLRDLRRAELFFIDLLHRKCIHPEEKKSDGELSTFRVDKHVQKIIVSLSDIHNLVTITSQDSANGRERVRYRSVQGLIRALHKDKEFQLSSTFVLDVSSNGDKTATSEALETSETPSFPSKLKRSKVLDLTDAPFQVVPDALFELTNARYLSIRNTSIKVIPDSIEMLTRLEFLDAKHSLVTELPPKVERLEKIRHILIYHHEKDPLTQSYNLIGFKASCSVKGFLDLEKLCFVESDNSILEDLGNLTKLRRLGITKLRKEHGESLCTSLGKLKELKSLNVHALDEDEILNLDYLTSPPESESRTSPLKSLKRLYLHGRLEKLPAWISSLNNLTKIMLRWSQLEEDLLATLGKLPNLVELELRRAYDGSQLDFKNEHFRKLKILLLEELEGLRSVSLEKGTMSCLENLTISRCQWLERMPSGIEHIRNIQKLTFFDMSHEFYDKVRADHEKDDYQIFKGIPEVYFTRWRAGHWEHCQVESTGEAHYSQQVKSTDEAHCSHQVESTDGINLKDIYFNLFKKNLFE
ncbi:disease resistance protein RPM1-like [Syzygium oleosum]|uniref:disease resistance protein RPM1-like n=1 Tax=Syzygium oleosum TaxID=219896 RepID=UPI0024B964A0|nr:disease resistance protein RPM1-like [Syzygium oleosum]